MAIKNKFKRNISGIGERYTSASGFALLIAVIFMSVVLTLGLALGSLGYKQQILASGAVESQYAFYAADTAMECALYADQKLNIFAYPLSNPLQAPKITCNNIQAISSSKTWDPFKFVITNQLSLDSNRCADVTIYKYKNPNPTTGIVTYIFSQGYDVPCSSLSVSGARVVSRGLNIHY